MQKKKYFCCIVPLFFLYRTTAGKTNFFFRKKDGCCFLSVEKTGKWHSCACFLADFASVSVFYCAKSVVLWYDYAFCVKKNKKSLIMLKKKNRFV